VDILLERVSREFRREAAREFAPGTSTVNLLTVGDRVRLADPAYSVASVTTLDANNDALTVEYTVDGQDLILKYGGTPLWSGLTVTVTYTRTAAIPTAVVGEVAAIVARHLSVDPLSAQAQSTSLSTSDYGQRFAAWVSSRALLTPEECKLARTYRYPGSAIIIQGP